MAPFDERIRLAEETPLVAGGDVNVEAVENLHRWGCTLERAASLTVDDVCRFLERYVDVKRRQWREDANLHPMTAYDWFDEMAGTLCSSLVSAAHLPQLPFGCPVDADARAEDVARAFLRSPYLEGIPLDELTFPSPDEITPSTSPADRRLSVFLVPIP